MMRETRTLKTLFPEPKPPNRRNFIRENVKNLRRMEKLFHSSNNGFKDLKHPKILSKNHGLGDNQNININALQKLTVHDISENESSKLLNQKSFPSVQKNKKKSSYIISNKNNSQKLSRPSNSINENNKQNYCYKNQVNNKTEDRDILKAHSEGSVHKQTNEINTKNETDKGNRNQGVQTIDTNDLDSLYDEGVIRYPTERNKETRSTKSYNTKNLDKELENNESDAKNGCESSSNDGVNHIKLNKERISLAHKLVNKLNGTTQQSNHRIGVVPKYIKERKEALLKEQEAKAAAKNSDCPSGHIPLPDDERLNTLSIVKKSYQELVDELNMLPIRTDTLRSQKRKAEIEKQLTKLEEAIKIFSRPKVFVKLNT